MLKFGKGDCCVVALYILSNKTKPEILEMAIENWYNPKVGGMHPFKVIKCLKQMGMKTESCLSYFGNEIHAPTAKKWAKENPGTYIAFNRTHCFILHDGEVIDYNFDSKSKKMRVSETYKVTGANVQRIQEILKEIKQNQEDSKDADARLKAMKKFIRNYKFKDYQRIRIMPDVYKYTRGETTRRYSQIVEIYNEYFRANGGEAPTYKYLIDRQVDAEDLRVMLTKNKIEVYG